MLGCLYEIPLECDGVMGMAIGITGVVVQNHLVGKGIRRTTLSTKAFLLRAEREGRRRGI